MFGGGMRLGLSVVFVLSFITCFSRVAYAQSPAVDNGIAWLRESQNVDGDWGTDPDYALVDTSEVLETFSSLSITDPSYSNGISWISSQSFASVDYLSRIIMTLSDSGDDVSADVDSLVDMQNVDGGFGGGEDAGSMILDTAHALRALKAVYYSDINIISYAIGYLLNVQNVDGGWGFYQGDDSNAYATALILKTLSEYKTVFDLSDEINNAVGYLLTKQNTDGGFGSSPSTVYETALAFDALIGTITDETVLGNAIGYLEDNQLPNGSWNDDPYSTALALRVLHFTLNPPPEVATGTFTGIVLDAIASQLVDGVALSLASDPSINTTTDKRGRFYLTYVPAGERIVQISAAGYVPMSVSRIIEAGEIMDLGILMLVPEPSTGKIRGRITDRDTGLPIVGAEIVMEGDYNGTVLTDGQGEFLVIDVPVGVVIMTVTKDGYLPVEAVGAVEPARTLLFNAALGTEPPDTGLGGLTGRLLDSATGRPVTGAEVTFLRGSWNGKSGSDGVFFIPDIAPGSHEISIAAPGYLDQGTRVLIMPGLTNDLGDVYLICAPSVSTITGAVNDALTGEPIEGAGVTIRDTNLSSITNAAGFYSISGVDTLSFGIKASAAGYNSRAYAFSSVGHWVYTIDFNLEPSRITDLRMTVSTDKREYRAHEDVIISIGVENVGDQGWEGMLNAEILDADGMVIAKVSGENPSVFLDPYQKIEKAIIWNTVRVPAGDYIIRGTVVGSDTGGYNKQDGIISEKEAWITITPDPAISGAIALTPPVTRLDLQTPIAVTAAVRNTGNVSVNTGMHIEASLDGEIVFTADTSVTDLAINNIREFDFESFIPQTGGTYQVTLVSLDPSMPFETSETLSVGDHPVSLFTIDPERSIPGDVRVAGKITLTGSGSAVASVSDPLEPLVKDAIQGGIQWEQIQTVNWQNGNKCYGCHLQTQGLIGAELSRDLVMLEDSKTGQLLNFMISCQTQGGNMAWRPGDSWGDHPVEATALYAWALSYYHDVTKIQYPLEKAVNYLISQQKAPGYWVSDEYDGSKDWWSDLGAWNPSTPFTAYTVIALSKAYRLSGNLSYKTVINKAAQYLFNMDYSQSIITAAHVIMGLKAAEYHIEDTSMRAGIQPRIETILEFLKANQNPDGGWGRYQGDLSDALPTAHVLYAMSQSELTGKDESLRAGTEYLLNVQNPEGTWSTEFIRKENVYPDMYIAATTWAIISLPGVLRLIDGISTDLSLTFPADVIMNDSSLIPATSNVTGDDLTYVWHFDGVTDKGTDLFLDLTVLDLAAGEQRAIAGDASLKIRDTYSGIDIALPIEVPIISGIVPYSMDVSTDIEKYGPDQDVDIKTIIRNLGFETNSAILSLSIEDTEGNEVASIPTIDIEGLNPAYEAPVLVGWNKRIKLVLDHTKIDEALTDFPIYVRLSDSSGLSDADLTGIFEELKIDPNDDFTGKDGSMPDRERWSGYRADIKDNQLRIKTEGGYNYLRSTFQFKGDFDMQVDYGFELYAGDQNGWANIFKIIDGNDNGKQLQLSRRYKDKHEVSFNKLVKGAWGVVAVYNTTEQSGTFRWTRKGDVFTGYLWDGTGWMQVDSYTYSDWSEITTVEFAANSFENNPLNIILLDNFGVNAGEVVYNDYRRRIAVTGTDGKTQYNVEISRWDSLSKEADLWVKVPSVSPTEDTVLYLYYDHAQTDNSYVGDTGSAPADKVWDANFVGVYHFEEQTGSLLIDSTAHKNLGVVNFSISSGGRVNTSPSGNAFHFKGAQSIRLPDNADFKPDYISIETLVKVDPSNEDWSRIFDRYRHPNGGYALVITNEGKFRFHPKVDDVLARADSAAIVEGDNQWHWVMGSYQGGYTKLHNDGDLDESMATIDEPIKHLGTPLIGAGYLEPYFKGDISELRVSNIARSTAWHRASYSSINDDFISFGQAEDSTDFDPSSIKTFETLWNTGDTAPGDYVVKAELYVNEEHLTERVAPFSILPDNDAIATISADRISYVPNQTVTLSSTVTSTSRNAFMPGLSARLTITREGAILLNDIVSLPLMVPGQLVQFKTYWNTASNPRGIYEAHIEVIDGSAVISTAQTSFEIIGTSSGGYGLTGMITAELDKVEQGTDVSLSYRIVNGGNEDVSGLDISILIVKPEKLETISTLSDAADLEQGSIYTNSKSLSTGSHVVDTYLAILRVQTADMTEPKMLGSAVFNILDITPPVVTVVSPAPGSTYSGPLTIAAAASDDASGVDSVEYRIDDETWALLPSAGAGSDLHSTVWSPTIADEGPHVVSLRSKDKAGNVSDPESVDISVEVLFGAITTDPDPVYQGRDETLTWTITNSSGENIDALDITIKIIDSDSGDTRETFTLTQSVVGGETVSGMQSVSTADLEPKVYDVELEAYAATMPAPKTMAPTTFEVRPGVEISKTIPDMKNLLVWINNGYEGSSRQSAINGQDIERSGEYEGDHNDDYYHDRDNGSDNHDDQKKCIQLDLLETILSQASDSYFVVFDKSDFQKEMRNPFYTDILILGDHHTLEDHCKNELTEQVFAGRGLVSSLYFEHGNDYDDCKYDNDEGSGCRDSLFGIRYNGKLSGNSYAVELLDSPISTAGLITNQETALRTEPLDPSTVVAWILDGTDGNDDHHVNNNGHGIKNNGYNNSHHKDNDNDDNHDDSDQYPGIVLNGYGEGTTVFFAFGPVMTVDDETCRTITDLLTRSIAYVHRPRIDGTARPSSLVPVMITVTSLGGELDVRLNESYPEGVSLYDPATGQWITDNPLSVDIHLIPDESRDVLYYALIPDSAGTYTFITEAGYTDNSVFVETEELRTEIIVEKSIVMSTQDVVKEIDLLSLVGWEKAKARNASMRVKKTLTRIAETTEDMDENIQDLLSAGQSFSEICSVDMSGIRLDIGNLILGWEREWYFSN